jgi:hypothetical protein
LVGLGSPSGGIGVQGIGLALSTPSGPVGAVDLDHDLAVRTQKAGQAAPKLPVPSIPQTSTGPNRVAQQLGVAS